MSQLLMKTCQMLHFWNGKVLNKIPISRLLTIEIDNVGLSVWVNALFLRENAERLLRVVKSLKGNRSSN